jgi:SAM-dependent methyltransferase
MCRLLDKYVSEKPGSVLDVGSWGMQSYKPLLEERGWQNTGLDLNEGPNVDLVVDDPFYWNVADSQYDLVVSGQAFEHIDFFWITFLEMARVLKPGGYIFLIAPSRGEQHRWPIDGWRFYPDGYSALAKWGGLKLIDVNNPWKVDASIDRKSMYQWGDTVGVFSKEDSENDTNIGQLRNNVCSYLAASGAQGSSEAFPEVLKPRHEESYLFTELAAIDLPIFSLLKALTIRIKRKAKHLRNRTQKPPTQPRDTHDHSKEKR